MTGTFTCNPRFDSATCDHQAGPSYCSFIRMQSPPYSSDVSKSPLGITVVATSDGTSPTLSPYYGPVSDTEAFYTPLEVTHIDMEAGSHAEEAVPGSPSSTFSFNHHDDSQLPDLTHESSPAVKARHTASSHVETHRRSKRKTTRSRASSTSKRGPRSTSRSTAGRSDRASRRSSLQMPSRAATYSQSSSNPHRTSNGFMSRQKREDLLLLHRDCCRLFQEGGFAVGDPQQRAINETTSLHDFRDPQASTSRFSSDYSIQGNSTSTSRVARTSLAPLSAPSTPSMPQFPMSPNFPPYSPSVVSERGTDRDGSDIGSVYGNEAGRRSNGQPDVEPPYQPVPATVIDWTSPSTRRREYEKIDRSSRGIRGLWRRIAPKWCQPGQERVPFFEEGKDGKGNYEGSVRRFRMDLPDEEEADEHEKPRVDMGGDGNKDFVISSSRLRNTASKLSSASCDRKAKWHCLKLRKRSTSVW
ncbi:hypothetical protein VTN00DRAFT_2591 [Thermoascus crustaceus]|uniref:uncharacterized protein n=1 Tax=Thermoascus crustaceus TaxID=5088 RepID=UPI003742BCD4